MSKDDKESSASDFSDRPTNQADQGQEPGVSPRNSAQSSGRARREEIMQRRRQNIDKLEARIVARTRLQRNPLTGQADLAQEQDKVIGADLMATPSVTSTAPNENKVEKLEGQGNTSTMATVAYTYVRAFANS